MRKVLDSFSHSSWDVITLHIIRHLRLQFLNLRPHHVCLSIHLGLHILDNVEDVLPGEAAHPLDEGEEVGGEEEEGELGEVLLRTGDQSNP